MIRNSWLVIFAVIIVLLLLPFPVHAAPKWLTAVPRAVGRSYGNMFTFRNKPLAIEQWATVGALVYDEKTTLDLFHRCAGCFEATSYSLYHGRQYGWGGAALNIALAGTEYSTLEQYATEIDKDDPSKFWRAIPYSLAAVPITIHLQAGIHNMGLAER